MECSFTGVFTRELFDVTDVGLIDPYILLPLLLTANQNIEQPLENNKNPTSKMKPLNLHLWDHQKE